MILWALLLTLVWCFLWGRFDPATLLGGLTLSSLLLWGLGVKGQAFPGAFWRKIVPGLLLLGFFLKELVVANAKVAWIVLQPKLSITSAIVAVPIQCKTDAEVSLLANLITLTPGTLSMEIDLDGGLLFVHAIHAADRDEVIREVHKMEKLVLGVLR